MVVMMDRWGYPNESTASYVWLPLERGTETGSWSFQWHNEWALGS